MNNNYATFTYIMNNDSNCKSKESIENIRILQKELNKKSIKDDKYNKIKNKKESQKLLLADKKQIQNKILESFIDPSLTYNYHHHLGGFTKEQFVSDLEGANHVYDNLKKVTLDNDSSDKLLDQWTKELSKSSDPTSENYQKTLSEIIKLQAATHIDIKHFISSTFVRKKDGSLFSDSVFLDPNFVMTYSKDKESIKSIFQIQPKIIISNKDLDIGKDNSKLAIASCYYLDNKGNLKIVTLKEIQQELMNDYYFDYIPLESWPEILKHYSKVKLADSPPIINITSESRLSFSDNLEPNFEKIIDIKCSNEIFKFKGNTQCNYLKIRYPKSYISSFWSYDKDAKGYSKNHKRASITLDANITLLPHDTDTSIENFVMVSSKPRNFRRDTFIVNDDSNIDSKLINETIDVFSKINKLKKEMDQLEKEIYNEKSQAPKLKKDKLIKTESAFNKLKKHINKLENNEIFFGNIVTKHEVLDDVVPLFLQDFPRNTAVYDLTKSNNNKLNITNDNAKIIFEHFVSDIMNHHRNVKNPNKENIKKQLAAALFQRAAGSLVKFLVSDKTTNNRSGYIIQSNSKEIDFDFRVSVNDLANKKLYLFKESDCSFVYRYQASIRFAVDYDAKTCLFLDDEGNLIEKTFKELNVEDETDFIINNGNNIPAIKKIKHSLLDINLDSRVDFIEESGKIVPKYSQIIKIEHPHTVKCRKEYRFMKKEMPYIDYKTNYNKNAVGKKGQKLNYKFIPLPHNKSYKNKSKTNKNKANH